MRRIQIPFSRPQIGQSEVDEVTSTLRSGHLSSGSKVKMFEERFAAAVGANYAVAVNSGTAALHLAVEAMGLKQGQAVLVPTMTFAATAEVIRHHGAIPILVDCDPVTGNIDLDDAERKVSMPVVGILPVHVGGLMMDVEALQKFASDYGLWLIEDAAHAFPASWRRDAQHPWQKCGEASASISCFSFSRDMTITTGEGGMAVTNYASLAQRLRMMAGHGISDDVAAEFSGQGSWYYQIVAAGYNYKLTDIAASLGLHQLERAEGLRRQREAIATHYLRALAPLDEIELPRVDDNRIQSWNLFTIKLNLERLSICRDSFCKKLRKAGIATAVHWRPLHLHAYYREKFGWQPRDFPVATSFWKRIISLPISPDMGEGEVTHVIETIKSICADSARGRFSERGDVQAVSSQREYAVPIR
jgi:dTDP-4-amino-4,6-dideoxygalactose transaminase